MDGHDSQATAHTQALCHEFVVTRMRRIDELVHFLELHSHLTAHALRSDEMSRYGIERVLCVLGMATSDVNRHIAQACSYAASSDYSHVVESMRISGVIHDELSEFLLDNEKCCVALAIDAEQVDVDEVAAAIPLAIRQYGAYGRAVSEWLLRQGS